jgi:hypothetical protein
LRSNSDKSFAMKLMISSLGVALDFFLRFGLTAAAGTVGVASGGGGGGGLDAEAIGVEGEVG